MKIIDFLSKHPFALIGINIPILIFVDMFLKLSDFNNILYFFGGSFLLVGIEKLVLDVLKPKIKLKSTEELIDASWKQYRSDKNDRI